MCGVRISMYFDHMLIAERQLMIDVKLFVKVSQYVWLTLD